MDEAFIKKVQPNSPEAEQSVIGAMIMDRGCDRRCYRYCECR